MTRRFAPCLAVALLASTPLTGARAENVTFAVIGPHEYELPVNYADFDAFVQYGFANPSNQTYTANGGLAHTTNSNLNVGLTKLVHFFTIKELPNVGLAVEGIVPEINANSGFGNNLYGIGDPLFAIVAWIKPDKNSTFGFQTFIQAPIGTKNFTNNYYDNISTIFYDYQAPTWDMTGDTGGIFRSTQRVPGTAPVNSGTSFFTNLRIGYKLNQPSIPIEPFVALDYEYDTAFRSEVTNAITTPHMQDLALGVGGALTISDKYSLTVRYSRSVYGENEVPTNAVYVKFVSILP